MMGEVRGVNYRNRSFRRNALYAAPDIFVQHDIADNQYMSVIPTVFEQFHDTMQIRHRSSPFACPPFAHTACSTQSHSKWPTRMWASCTLAVSFEATFNEASPMVAKSPPSIPVKQTVNA